MRRTRSVRELVSHPYEAKTAFHKESSSCSDAGQGFRWLTQILEYHYGLRGRCSTPITEVSPGTHGFATASLRTELGDPFLFLGSAEPGYLADCELALRKHLLDQRTATMAVGSDGSQHVFLRRRHDTERCEYSKDIERENLDKEQFMLFRNDAVGKEGGRLESVFFDAHCAIRDIDGMHDDEALDELCKLLFTLIALGGDPTESSRLTRMPDMGADLHFLEHAAVIRRVYRDAAGTYGSTTSGDAFSTPLRLSDAALLRVWRLLASQDIQKASTDLKGRAFQRVLDPAIRAGMGQFFTPTPIVEFVVAAVQPRIGESILDPFCGSGHFLTRSIEFAVNNGTYPPHEITEWANAKLHGIEKSERMVRIAQTDQLLHGARFISLHHQNALSPFANFSSLRAGTFDVVLTNPPFGSLLGPDAVSALGVFELVRGRGNTPLEVLGLERSIQFLCQGGRLGIVLPEGILSNQRMTHVRSWLLRHVRVVAIVTLPVETFAPYGANVRTCILFAVKRTTADEGEDYPIVVGGAESIGYDASGRNTATPSDLPSLADVVRAAFDTTVEA